MKRQLLFSFALFCIVFSKGQITPDNPSLTGTWQMISAKAISNGDTSINFSAKDQKMIKIINGTHFAFFNHDLGKGKDSSAIFDSGAGTYTLSGDIYTEHLGTLNLRFHPDLFP